MGLRDLLSIPRKHRRALSKDRSEAGPIEGGQVDLSTSSHPEPDLAIGSLISPTSVPSTSHSTKPDSTRTTLFLVVHLTILLPNPDFSERTKSVFGKRRSKRPNFADYTVDPSAAHEKEPSWKSTAYSATKLPFDLAKGSSGAFRSLKSVAGSLSVILKHCDVWPIFRLPFTHDIYCCPSKQWNAVER